MLFKLKNHKILSIFYLFTILTNCQLQEPSKNHGIIFLENRSKKLVLNRSNKNDVINIVGQPHSKSINNENEWFYIERVLTKGKYHKLGKNVLKSNNILILNFDNFGILKSKDFLSKDDIQNIKFSNNETQNTLSKKSFVQRFLTSIKQKMYGNK